MINGPGIISVNRNPDFCAGSNNLIEVNIQNPGTYLFTWELPNGTNREIRGTNGNLVLNNVDNATEGSYVITVEDEKHRLLRRGCQYFRYRFPTTTTH
ncbi:MAG: hypothetical protein HC912_08345 [Saprospiraceae bacterium]|nr:hypothetical protein [Saprospiraceae bacterium]